MARTYCEQGEDIISWLILVMLRRMDRDDLKVEVGGRD